jgi:ubiquinone/menaquinone biosynthesis C-methylase UbiE
MMSVVHKRHGDMPTATDGRGGALIRNARLYEAGAAVQFMGRRRRVYDELVARSGAKAGDSVLDIGCGTGYFTRRAACAVTPGGEVIGIDPSAPMIDYASRSAAPNCSFQVGSAQDLPFPDASFDLVISSLAFHHLPVKDRSTALSQAYRVLRPGGRLLIAELGRRSLHNRAVHRLVGVCTRHRMSHPAFTDLEGLVSGGGFLIIGDGDLRPFFHYVQAQRPEAEGDDV